MFAGFNVMEHKSDVNETFFVVYTRGSPVDGLHITMLYIQVSNRRSRKWMNDRLLIELVPRLHVEEIKGLFAPPPWGKLQMLL